MATFWSNVAFKLPQMSSGTAPWRQEVHRRHIMLMNDLARLDLQNANEEAERTFLIEKLLPETAKTSTTQKWWSIPWANIKKWWWGTDVERAWGVLREVEERTIDLIRPDELPARGAGALAHADYYKISANDQSRQRLDTLLKTPAVTNAATTAMSAALVADLRSTIIDVLRVSHAQSDRNQQQARYLRNRLILASMATAAFSITILLAQWRFPVTPFIALPTDWSSSEWSFLLVVMFFGGVGALISAIPVVSRILLDFSPFNLPLQQAILKLALGPLIALIGLLVINAGVATLTTSSTLAPKLLLAIVFGAGQQAVTQFVDERAKQILSATPSYSTA